jgi:hypothetical protein
VQIVTGGAFFLVLGVILAAGLWPFNPFPANEVSWLKGRNGLLFGRHPLVISRSPIRLPDPGSSSVSLVIWVQATKQHPSDQLVHQNTLLSIWTPENPRQFRLIHYRDDLLVRRDASDPTGYSKKGEIRISNLFHRDAESFITIAAGPGRTAVYVDGKRVDESNLFGLTQSDLSGQLILGTSPIDHAPWLGELRGLAVYPSELSPVQALAHFQKWMQNRELDLTQEEKPAALYDFHEGSGQIVHNLGSEAPDLVIPEHYTLPHKLFLELPWNEFHADRAYVKDILLNVAAFVPLGMAGYAFFLCGRPRHSAVWTTILLGFATSATIEVLQGFLPNRFSGCTDILTNTAGTGIGVYLCAQTGMDDLLQRLRKKQVNEGEKNI